MRRSVHLTSATLRRAEARHIRSCPTFPLDVPSALDAEATYDLLASGWFDSPIQYAGEDVTTVKVATRAGAGSTVTYYTASGRGVPEHAVLAAAPPEPFPRTVRFFMKYAYLMPRTV